MQALADKSFGLLNADPRHPSLHFRKVGRYWSARVGLHHRAVAVEAPDGLVWFWIGAHLAEEVAPHGIRANAVCPGIVSGTAMRAQVEALGRDLGLPSAVERVAGIPLGRLADPEDVASVVTFLASDKAGYMTGQAINVTGGLWMH